MTDVFWIPDLGTGRLGLMPRPRGGGWLADEIKALSQQGVNVLVSALTISEIQELELTEEHDLCLEHGIEFRSIPILDRSAPSSIEKMRALLTQIDTDLTEGKTTVVHCRMGIGRAGTICAGVLVVRGETPTSALGRVSKARGLQVPDTPEQIAWLANLPRQLRSESE